MRESWKGVLATIAGVVLRKLAKSERSWLAVAALVLVNLLPVAAVLWRGWQPGDVLTVYWLESIAIGFWTCVKIRTARGPERTSPFRNPNGSPLEPTVPRFAFLFGFFVFVHGGLIGGLCGAATMRWYGRLLDGVFWLLGARSPGSVLDTLGENRSAIAASPAGYWGMLVVFLASQGFAYRQDWVRGRDRDRVGRTDVRDSALWRTLVLQFTLIAGFFLLGVTGQPIAVALLLIAFKVVLDVAMYFVRRARSTGTGQSGR
ncbi:DUF6498-containing protein [Amycolatopsis sp. CA-230715]|uniref:DUF6498-containing protein n=1 Tax=Amycolatopsis sp. CA-230715 TaxID=2745196 RepID=UPI001C01FE0C|nr:DUF6498-containing protein [Amycolatopsis sp. CA-230715]QWF78972.1 hypothetical protein HUW46_02372 [Amycolatopsis sp. CA-230715]